MGSLGVHRDIARGAIKGDAVHGLNNPKGSGNAIHPYIERIIHLQKLGSAGLSALGTPVVFNPMLAGRHPTNMQLRLLRSTSICRPQSNSKNVSSYVAWNHWIDAEGRSCIYVPITQNGKVVDSQGFTFEQSRGSVVLDREQGEASAMMIDPEAKLLAVLDHAETYRGLAIRAKDRGERESYERIVELYVEIAEELEALIDGWASP
jgi:hypothetical protein